MKRAKRRSKKEKTREQRTRLLISACTAPSADRLRILLSAGANPNTATDEDESLLSYSVVWERVESVRALIEFGVDVEQVNSGWSPLMYAAYEGHIEIAELLLAAGARAARLDRAGRTAAEIAERYGHADLARILRAAAENDRQSDASATKDGGPRS